MKLNILTIALFAFLSSTCSTPSAEENVIDKFYTKNEIQELDRITNFVVNQMSRNCAEKSVECLYQYFDKFKELRAADEFEIGFPLDAQKEILQSFDETLFYDLWEYCDVEKQTSNGHKNKYRELCINSNGRFAKFLNELTSDKEDLRRYGETLQLAGGFSPYMTATLLKQTERFNLQSKNEMLIVAIHLFTLNYSEEMK